MTEKIKIASKVPLMALVSLSVLVLKIAVKVVFQKHQFTKVVTMVVVS